jgi:glycosyltransferase involved in cell wall biosynthesis
MMAALTIQFQSSGAMDFRLFLILLIGAALRLGYDIAVAGGAKIVLTMDGDGQHRPNEIERLVKPILDDEVDIVIGSRLLGQCERDSKIRWIGIHLFNFIINLLAGTRITDCSNGFRSFRVESLKKIVLLQDQFHTAELIWIIPLCRG